MSENFQKAIRKLPPPVPCFANGAICPWCGAVHATITFGENTCIECGKFFAFGYPDWHQGDDPISHVPFPWKEFEAVGQNPDALPDWEPNDRLKSHYHDIKERETGIVSPMQ